MNYEKVVKDLFNFIYQKKYGRIGLSKSFKNEETHNFIKSLHTQHGIGSIGIQFLSDFFCYQFNYWEEKEIKRNISLNWIIGEKALIRWNKKHSNYQYFYKKDLLDKYLIRFAELLSIGKENSKDNSKVNQAEEVEKQFFEGNLRLFHCLENTTLYNPYSKICLLCSERKECKEILINDENLQSVTIKRKLYEWK